MTFFEDLNVFVGLIAGIPAVLALAALSLRILRGRYAVVRRDRCHIVARHDPGTAVTGELSYMDVRFGIAFLVADAHRYEPTVMYGINRGGAIVGGKIAMALGLPVPYVLDINFDRRKQRVEDRGPAVLPPNARILLLDDGHFTGDHMRAAVKHLQKRFPNAVIRRSVLLERVGQRRGPEFSAFRGGVDVSAFHTYDERARLPWHVDRIDLAPQPGDPVLVGSTAG